MTDTWQPLREGTPTVAAPSGLVDGEEYLKVYKNDRYTVWHYCFGAWDHLSVKRNDQEPIHDWRHLQQIKNEICGSSREAVELYPASDRVLDACNQYHLWVLPQGKRMNIGSQYRVVITSARSEELNAHYGLHAKQRAFEEGLTI